MEEHQRLQGQPRRQPGKSGGGAVLGQSQAKPKPSRPQQPGFRRASDARSNQRQEVGKVPIVLGSTRSTLPEIVLHQQVKALQKPSSSLGPLCRAMAALPASAQRSGRSGFTQRPRAIGWTCYPQVPFWGLPGFKEKTGKTSTGPGKGGRHLLGLAAHLLPQLKSVSCAGSHSSIAGEMPQEEGGTAGVGSSMISIRRGLGSSRPCVLPEGLFLRPTREGRRTGSGSCPKSEASAS